jgi:AcrR family transcriptional regulator
MNKQALNTSLPGEILETAYSCFQKKGFEKTTISDICKSLHIKSSQFYRHFESLDEVLEILWAR